MDAKFEVKMTPKIMFDFLLSHTYRSFSGWFGIVFGAAVLILAAVTFGKVSPAITAVYLLFAVYLLPMQPILLYFRAAKQVKLNPAFKEPIAYTVSKEGITSAQNGQEASIAWDQVVKVTETKLSYLVYTGKRYSFILPKESMGSQITIVMSLMKKYMRAEQMKVGDI